ncbi:MAG: 50S ribosomal protein L32 [Clostridia bacterium]|jgi:large subunit ribosomal protein L32|nr:50S ribosomal protein L32 [Clostridia bacterium]
MAVPKYKVSKARRDKRKSSNSKITLSALVECPFCHELKQPHKVCPKCGVYKGKKVLDTEKKEKKEVA